MAVIIKGAAYLFCQEFASSCGLSSGSEASMSMLAALSGAKKFLVGTVLGVVLTAAGPAVTSIFFGVRAALLLLWRLGLRTSWKPTSWVGFFVVCVVVMLTFSSAFNSCKANV
jgi:hypothetical protein